MSGAKRVLLQGIPLALVILSLGMAHQYANGAGVFEPETGLLAQAHEMIASFKIETRPDSATVDETSIPGPSITAEALRQQLSSEATPQPVVTFQRTFSSPVVRPQSGFGHCRH